MLIGLDSEQREFSVCICWLPTKTENGVFERKKKVGGGGGRGQIKNRSAIGT